MSLEPEMKPVSVKTAEVGNLTHLWEVILSECHNSCASAHSATAYFDTWRPLPLTLFEINFIHSLNFAHMREIENQSKVV